MGNAKSEGIKIQDLKGRVRWIFGSSDPSTGVCCDQTAIFCSDINITTNKPFLLPEVTHLLNLLQGFYLSLHAVPVSSILSSTLLSFDHINSGSISLSTHLFVSFSRVLSSGFGFSGWENERKILGFVITGVGGCEKMESRSKKWRAEVNWDGCFFGWDVLESSELEGLVSICFPGYSWQPNAGLRICRVDLDHKLPWYCIFVLSWESLDIEEDEISVCKEKRRKAVVKMCRGFSFHWKLEMRTHAVNWNWMMENESFIIKQNGSDDQGRMNLGL